MEGDEEEGVDIGSVDPDLAELLNLGQKQVNQSHTIGQEDYPTQSVGPPTEADEAALRGNPHEGGIEDDEFDQILGKPEELLKKVDLGQLPWAPGTKKVEEEG